MLRNEHTFPKDSFLGNISQESWTVLSKLWTTRHYKSGQFLISADDDNDDIFFVIRGAARVTIYTPAGREVSFVQIKAGDSFGEFAAIDNAPRSSSVVATGECFAAVISADQFRTLLQTDPDISFGLLKIMVAHLRQLSKRVIDFNAKSANLRLQEALLSLAEHHSQGTDDILIERPPTQSELAAYIFSSREGVAREMGRLRKAGIVARKKRSLYIPSVDRLRQVIADNQ
jgi:CRP/FNR family transcriptional regulator, cyclic AMP receptor protein